MSQARTYVVVDLTHEVNSVLLDLERALLPDVLLTSRPFAAAFLAIFERVVTRAVDHDLQGVVSAAEGEDLVNLVDPTFHAVPGLGVEGLQSCTRANVSVLAHA